MPGRAICLFGRGQFFSFVLVYCPAHMADQWHTQFGYYRKYRDSAGLVFEWWDLPADCYDLWADQFRVGDSVLVRV